MYRIPRVENFVKCAANHVSNLEFHDSIFACFSSEDCILTFIAFFDVLARVLLPSIVNEL